MVFSSDQNTTNYFFSSDRRMSALDSLYVNYTSLSPHCVDFAITGFFTEETCPTLIISCLSSLEVFKVLEFSGDQKLYFIDRIPIFGEIAGLNSIHRPGRKLDSVLVSFKTAKVCIPFSKYAQFCFFSSSLS